MTFSRDSNTFEFTGLSTDTKPIGLPCTNANVKYRINGGSTFFCMDTSTVFMFSMTPTTSEGVTTYTGSWLEL